MLHVDMIAAQSCLICDCTRAVILRCKDNPHTRLLILTVPLCSAHLSVTNSTPYNARSSVNSTAHKSRVFTETPIWLNFWLVILNDQAESAKWEFDSGEALALMGSHTLIDNQVRIFALPSVLWCVPFTACCVPFERACPCSPHSTFLACVAPCQIRLCWSREVMDDVTHVVPELRRFAHQLLPC